MAKNSLTLRKSLTTREFFNLAHCVAMNYATTGASTARSVLCEKYDITETTFYTLIDIAITHHLVSEKTVDAISEKMLANLSAHGNKGYKSKIKHNNLLTKRENYSAFTKKDIIYIVKYYANHPEKNKNEVAKIFSFANTKPLDQLLKKACSELICTDKIFELLRKRALASSTPENMNRTISFFNELEKQRTEIKEIKKKQKNISSAF